jgi:hypothetical protein
MQSRLAGAGALFVLIVSMSPSGVAADVYPGPTPRTQCGPDSKPETGRQGRVTAEDQASGRAAQGFSCNTQLLSHFPQ